MELHIINTGNFMADGGAIFGVVPKVMWEKKYPCDENNYCNLTMRCLLIKTGDRVILIDTGIGDKQSEKFLSYQHLNGDDSMEKSFAAIGTSYDEVTDVILTHLHFDHCGGAVKRDAEDNLVLTFPNATHWLAQAQWDNFNKPNIREGSVYFKENILPVLESGQLKFIKEDTQLIPEVEMRLFNGHTKGQIIPLIQYKDKTLVYTADLIPVMPSVPEAWVSAYDADPITAMTEKREFLKEAVEKEYILFFEHDLYNECCHVIKTDKGIKEGESFKLDSIL
ncbi:MBL fold metallo-hydrolase [Labilibacter marinus]|uniref:MBL fold metallo-hydrolase n=1 Tax=Labilibacter marinus TaxID=1477105 RepID=UPI00082CF567|nr:MBL fold metallo-hydrolase [Labilibacter marinus]